MTIDVMFHRDVNGLNRGNVAFALASTALSRAPDSIIVLT